MLLLEAARKVGGERDLGLDLLLAVAEVVVGDQGDHHTRGGTAGQLERTAVVVKLVWLSPGHPVAALALGGGLPGRQAQLFLGEPASSAGRAETQPV